MIRYTHYTALNEFLDDPLNEEVYRVFLQVKDTPRHISIKAEQLLNEVYALCAKFYKDKIPAEHLEEYAQEVGADLGWYYAADLVMSIAYVLLRSQKRNSAKIENLMTEMRETYQKNCYWLAFSRIQPLRDKKASRHLDINRLFTEKEGKTIVIQIGNAEINVNSGGNIIGKEIKYGTNG